MFETCLLRSSAIIPFAVETATQTIYILLAQTARACRRSGMSGATWGDLGGGCEGGETSECTAAREFAEESLGAVNTHLHHESTSALHSSIESELLDGSFYLRIRIFYRDVKASDSSLSYEVGNEIAQEQSTNSTVPTHCRDFYLKEFPFDASISKRFNELREGLLRVPEGIDRSLLPPLVQDHPALDGDNCIIGPQFLEKQNLQWFSLDHAMDLVAGNGYHRGVRIRLGFLAPLRTIVSELLCFVPDA